MSNETRHGSSILTGDKNVIKRCSLVNCALNNSWVKKSTLDECVLSNCNVSRTTARDSQLYDVGFAKHCGITATTIQNQGFMQQSTITRSEIRDSVTISQSYLTNTTISQGYFYKATLVDCDVTNCDISKSTLRGMILKYGVWKGGILVGGVGGRDPVIIKKDAIMATSTDMPQQSVVELNASDDIQPADDPPDYCDDSTADRPPPYVP